MTTPMHGLRYPALAAVAAIVAATSFPSAQTRPGPTFYADDPLKRIADTQDASGVQPRELSLTFDAIVNLFGRPGAPLVGRAGNVNTIDEVPDSSWFTNRPPLTAEQMERGPDDDRGPAAGQWNVTRKAMGASAGFTITDARGRRYFLKFDPPGEPELGTAAEAIVTRLFHALGYNVPQTNIATLRREDLAVAPDATVRTPDGGRRPMHRSDIDEQLRRAHPNPDGTYRVVAGSAAEGRPVEGFKYEGTRPDDPNDVVPHEHRRELRGLRVFSAWVSHTDAKAINSLDTVVTSGGRGYVRHHLIDFNAALGSAGIGPKERRDGYEYLAETGPAKRALFAFGFAVRPWMTIDYPRFRGVGRFESKRFVPEEWRPRVPNPAYIRSRPDDTFWAARRLMATMTDDLIRAAVHAGKLTDPAAERYLADTLIERRDKIARAWLTNVNPIAEPSLAADGTLTFQNAAVRYAGAAAPGSYRAVWHRFDNTTGETQQIGESTAAGEHVRAANALPEGDGAFIRVDISAATDAHPAWNDPVHAYFRRTGNGWTLVGFERMPGAPPMRPGLVGAERAAISAAAR